MDRVVKALLPWSFPCGTSPEGTKHQRLNLEFQYKINCSKIYKCNPSPTFLVYHLSQRYEL